MWMLTTAMSSLIILNFGDVQSLFIKTGLAIAAIGLSWQAVKILRVQGRSLPFKYAFIRINVFALLVIVFLSIDKLMNGL